MHALPILEEITQMGREAYQAYGETVGFKNYQGLAMPTFDNLTPLIRQTWINAASRVMLLQEELAKCQP